MNDKLPAIIEESIKLELNVAMLYKLFSHAFPDDADLWEKLFWEEKHHATLIKSMRDALLPSDEFPAEVVAPSLRRLNTANNKITSLIEKYTADPPPRKYAFTVAISTEKSVGEIHYQHAMEAPSNSKHVKIWQKLNEDDKDHAKRISTYKNLKRD
jgi:rubrerythrin